MFTLTRLTVELIKKWLDTNSIHKENTMVKTINSILENYFIPTQDFSVGFGCNFEVFFIKQNLNLDNIKKAIFHKQGCRSYSKKSYDYKVETKLTQDGNINILVKEKSHENVYYDKLVLTNHNYIENIIVSRQPRKFNEIVFNVVNRYLESNGNDKETILSIGVAMACIEKLEKYCSIALVCNLNNTEDKKVQLMVRLANQEYLENQLADDLGFESPLDDYFELEDIEKAIDDIKDDVMKYFKYLKDKSKTHDIEFIWIDD